MKNCRDVIAASPVRFGTSGARGLVTDLNAEVCTAYTLAFLHSVVQSPGSTVVMGIDLRPSSIAIARICAAAIAHAGYRPVFCGVLPTPALAYYAQELALPAVMITGSHIPFDRNGIKFYRPDGEISKADEAAISATDLLFPEDLPALALPEIDLSAYRLYLERYLNFFQPQLLAGLRLGFYEHSSAARDLLKQLLEELGAEVISIERTDQFVPIDTEAVSEQDGVRAKRWAERFGFDAIVSTDGDADRPLIGNRNGQWLRGDSVGILCAQYLKAMAIATPINTNTAVEKCGRFEVLRTRIGSPFVIEGMEALVAKGNPAVVGFEANGGFLVATDLEREGRRLKRLPTRDAVLPMLALLAMSRARGADLAELAASLPQRFTASDRLTDFSTVKSLRLVEKLENSTDAVRRFAGEFCGNLSTTDRTDGLRLIFENGEILHLRPSGNAPELRCYAESDSQARADALVRACLARVGAMTDLE